MGPISRLPCSMESFTNPAGCVACTFLGYAWSTIVAVFTSFLLFLFLCWLVWLLLLPSTAANFSTNNLLFGFWVVRTLQWALYTPNPFLHSLVDIALLLLLVFLWPEQDPVQQSSTSTKVLPIILCFIPQLFPVGSSDTQSLN